MREFKGIQYWNCDDMTDEEMDAIHGMDMDDNSRDIRKRVFDRNGWNTLPSGLFRREVE